MKRFSRDVACSACLAILLVAIAPPASAFQPLRDTSSITIKKGVLRKQLLGSSLLLFQTISVQNSSGKFLEFVTVECGFIQDGNIIGSGVQFFNNLKAGETAYGEVLAQVEPGYEAKNIATECRLSHAVLPD